MIPETTRELLLAAMEEFDRQLRDSPGWAGWEGRGQHRYAIAHEGRHYPVKQIIAMATGVSRESFLGGTEANGYLARYGLSVIPLRGGGPNIWWVNQGESYQLAREEGYISAPQQSENGATPLHWRTMGEVREGDIIVHCVPPSIRALGRARANVAVVPPAPTGELKQTSVPRWRVEVEYHDFQRPIPLKQVAEQLRELAIPNGPLSSRGTVNQGYLWRFNRDGLRILRAASTETWPAWAEEAVGESPSRAWIFQANPGQWDLVGAVAELAEFTWRVRQHPHDIHVGDTVYLWEAGDRAGIVAVATVLTEPAVLPADEAERRFSRGGLSADPQLRVRLRIERALPDRISRQQLLAHPILKDLRILAMPQGTNFAMTAEQADALHTLVTGPRTPRVVKIAPGENAHLWPDCRAGGYICIAWDEVGDLRSYPSQEDFLTAFRIHFPASGAISANSLWSLLDLAPGDLIVANRGKSEILGVGEVVAPGYEFRADRPSYQHTVRVRWDTSVARPVPPQHGWVRTIVPVSPEQYAQLLGAPPQLPPTPMPAPQHTVTYPDLLAVLAEEGLAFSPETVSNYLLALQAKRFVVLTGISGTGKTQLALKVAEVFSRSSALPASENRTTDSSVGGPGAGSGTAGNRVYFSRSWPVARYMLDRRELVIPDEVLRQLSRHFGYRSSTAAPLQEFVEVHYPEGMAKLGAYRRSDNASYLQFDERFGSWFARNLRYADPFIIDVIDATEVTDEKALRIRLPHAAAQASPSEARHTVRDQGDTPTNGTAADQYLVTAVRPDWTDNRGLLGYFNPLTGDYAATPFLRLLLRAHEEEQAAQAEDRPPRPFFVVLDEMNLARVEHYFSDFLSAMESGEPLELHDDERIARGETGEATPVPRRLPIPANLFFTGTVNVDETTYLFSPKVLDRAFTLEFNRVDLRAFGAEANFPPGANGAERAGGPASADTAPAPAFELVNFPGILRSTGRPEMTDWDSFGTLLDGGPRRLVIDLHELLAAEGRHFGYRVANEIARFVTLAARQAGDDPATLRTALDLAILQKVLPKFHGTQQELGDLLTALFDFAVTGRRRALPEPSDQLPLAWRLARDQLVSAAGGAAVADAPVMPALPRTAAKLWGMLKRLRQQGFASFIE